MTSGEYGNIESKFNFETQSIINSQGNLIDIADDEITIYNNSGFNFGSNGTDVNALRAAIGFNHGVNLLFDKIDVQNPKHLAIAINFYDKLNKLTDETLDSSNYSREEINQGLNDILDEFGIKIDFK